MDEYIRIFIDYPFENLRNNYFDTLNSLIHQIEQEDACAIPAFGIGEDLQGAVLLGLTAYMRQSTFENMKWLKKLAGLEERILEVSFEIQTCDYNKTQQTVSELIKNNVDIDGYWKRYFGNNKPKSDCGIHKDKTFHYLSELKNEQSSIWDLRCKMKNSQEFENLFGTELILTKQGHLTYPKVKFAITKGPKIPSPLKELIAEITFPYNL